jgi:uncharacterized protein YraI
MVPWKHAVLATGLLALASGVASAAPALVENDLNLRAGPGTNYGIIAAMPQGTMVDAWNCGSGWCRVNFAGRTGFASARYLDIGRAGAWRPGYRSYAYSPGYGSYAYAPGYRSYAYAPGYAYRHPPLFPNPLDFPLLPWNW